LEWERGAGVRVSLHSAHTVIVEALRYE